MAVKLGVTGGIGSGKSVVSRLLRMMGVPVYDADTEAKRLTEHDAGIRRELTALLGASVYVNDRLNKPMLAGYLFEGGDQAGRVNAIIHPRVREDFRRWAALHAEYPVIAMECAILIEADFTREVDVTAVVCAPLALRLQRTVTRDGVSPESVRKRMQCQLDDEERQKHADCMVINDEITPLIPQVEALLQFVYSFKV